MGTTVTVNVGGAASVSMGGAAPPAALSLDELAEATSSDHSIATIPPEHKAETDQPVELKEYTMEEVAKHNTEKDCWVVVNGQVLDVTKFLPDHPGGKMAIVTFAGKDATEEFNMIHPPDVIGKYAPDAVIGTLGGGGEDDDDDDDDDDDEDGDAAQGGN